MSFALCPSDPLSDDWVTRVLLQTQACNIGAKVIRNKSFEVKLDLRGGAPDGAAGACMAHYHCVRQ
jgi:hypothetical protein